MQVIVCEDDITYQKSIQEKIARWSEVNHHADVTVRIFSSSEDLLGQWGRGMKADMILLDIMFDNEINGMELAKHIRQTDAYVPIVWLCQVKCVINCRDRSPCRDFSDWSEGA